jgi:hypothetical protein
MIHWSSRGPGPDPDQGTATNACLERVEATGDPARFETHLHSHDRWLDISVFRAATRTT